MMKRIAFAVALAALAAPASAQVSVEVTPPPSVQLPEGAAPSALLPALVEHSRRTARIESGRLVGEGGDFLRALGAQSQFVLIGEEHGNAGIADFTAALWRDLNAHGYNYYAIETDPWIAEHFERELRAGGVEAWTQFLQRRGHAASAPFMTWAPEARVAELVVETSQARREPALWGLDQVFLGAAPLLLRDIAATARDAEARRLAGAFADAAARDLNWLGNSNAQSLIDLRARLNHHRDRRYAELVEAMIASQRIYRPFTGGGGEAWLANTEREMLMKTLFLERYRAAARADGEPPRVMLKFGSYHMYRGASPTHVQGLGGFVTELAVQEGASALALHVTCGPGGFVGTLQQAPVACDGPFAENYDFLAPFVSAEEITVFDLRPWKMRPRRWEHLPPEIRQLIDAYDVLVVVPNGAASEFLPGLPMPSLPSQ
jgi:hypothetical protein